MGLLQQWAMRAHEQGRRGRLIERVLADPDFERHALEIFQEQAVRQRESIREATTSDFPDLVGAQSQVERALIAQAALQTPTWRKYARIASLGDLKPVSRLRRSDTDRFGVVLEGAEAGQGNFSSYRVDYSPAKYELVLEFTWEMFVNDDLGAFQHIGHDLAQGAMNTVGDFVVGLLTSADPIYDGAPLFDGSRTNQSTDLLDVEGLQAGITAMRSQLSEKGHPLHIVPGYLVVPPELEFQAKTLVHSSLVPGGQHQRCECPAWAGGGHCGAPADPSGGLVSHRSACFLADPRTRLPQWAGDAGSPGERGLRAGPPGLQGASGPGGRDSRLAEFLCGSAEPRLRHSGVSRV